MKAISVFPGKPNSVHLAELPKPAVKDIPNGRGVLAKVVPVGVNANREYCEMGVKDMAQAEADYPGWLGQLLTGKIQGLEICQQMFEKLKNPNGAIEVNGEVAPLP